MTERRKNKPERQSEPRMASMPTPININEASREQLLQVRGLREEIVRQILDYRQKNGRFRSVDELRDVPSITDSEFQRLKGQVTV